MFPLHHPAYLKKRGGDCYATLNPGSGNFITYKVYVLTLYKYYIKTF